MITCETRKLLGKLILKLSKCCKCKDIYKLCSWIHEEAICLKWQSLSLDYRC